MVVLNVVRVAVGDRFGYRGRGYRLKGCLVVLGSRGRARELSVSDLGVGLWVAEKLSGLLLGAYDGRVASLRLCPRHRQTASLADLRPHSPARSASSLPRLLPRPRRPAKSFSALSNVHSNEEHRHRPPLRIRDRKWYLRAKHFSFLGLRRAERRCEVLRGVVNVQTSLLRRFC